MKLKKAFTTIFSQTKAIISDGGSVQDILLKNEFLSLRLSNVPQNIEAIDILKPKLDKLGYKDYRI